MLDAPMGLSGPKQNVSADCHSIAIIDNQRVMLSASIADSFSLAIMSIASDDPGSFDEMNRLWPRYRTHAFPERLDSVPFVIASFEQLQQVLSDDPFFVVIDLDNKRILTGSHHPALQSQMMVSRNPSIDGEKQEPISFDLPPWWMLSENSDPDAIFANENSAPIPNTNREFLYGRPFAQAIASELFRAFVIYQAKESVLKSKDIPRHSRSPAPGIVPYDVSIEIHRHWLMTPRPKIDGCYPRQLLHGARDWIDALAMAQQRRYLNGLPMVAVPADLGSVQYAPMGLAEMSTYFDICRHAIASGWAYLHRRLMANEFELQDVIFPSDIDALANDILESINRWTGEIADDGISPGFIIDCDRRRVPLGSQLDIVGIDPVLSPKHPAVCDCEICNMMESGVFGPSFEFFDGHHLEIDDEFAFSMYETRSEWESNRWGGDDWDSDHDESSDVRSSTVCNHESDSSSSLGDSATNGLLIGDSDGFIQLALDLSEIIAELQGPDLTEVFALEINNAYVEYRMATPETADHHAQSLSKHLELIADLNPELTLRIAQCHRSLEHTLQIRGRNTQPAL